MICSSANFRTISTIACCSSVRWRIGSPATAMGRRISSGQLPTRTPRKTTASEPSKMRPSTAWFCGARMCQTTSPATTATSASLACNTPSDQKSKCDAIAAPVTISTPIAASVPHPKRRATARVARRSSPVARSTGSATAARNSWPPTKKAIASRCSQSTMSQSVIGGQGIGGRIRSRAVNFTRDIVDAAVPARLALVELARDGTRREWSFAEVASAAGGLAGTLAARGVQRGDVVVTLIGNRPEWALAMVACFRLGAVALPCSEQLRARDLSQRLDVARPRAIVADARNRAELEPALAAHDGDPELLLVPAPGLLEAAPPPAVDLDPEDPCLITFTSGTAGPPKGVVHAQRYLAAQRVQAEHWLDAGPGDLVWCTAASGWSKSARNAFIAAWLRGGAALLHDARFDPDERLDVLARERPTILCMAPTEYRVMAKRADPERLRSHPTLRGLVAAGEALNPEVLRAWHAATGHWIRDGYGQTETGQLTGMPKGDIARPGSMGRPLPGMRLWVQDGELCAEGASVPTFFTGYLGQPGSGGPDVGVWRTGDRVRQDEDGFLYFEGRGDDLIISAGYRIGPFEVESALVEHPAVAEAAVVAAPDDERGSVVRAVVVLRDDRSPSDALARELQEHVKARTAPYKYPRIVDFAAALPKRPSGKVRRAELRASSSGQRSR